MSLSGSYSQDVRLRRDNHEKTILCITVCLLILSLMGCNLVQEILTKVFENDYADVYAENSPESPSVDEDPPVIVDIVPSTAQPTLNPFSPILIYFDDLLNPESIDENVVVTRDDDSSVLTVKLVLSIWNGYTLPRAQLAIIPVGGWPLSQPISIEILGGLLDNAGNPFDSGSSYEVGYTTGSASSTQYTAKSYSFEDGNASVFTIEGRGGLFSFSDTDVAADVDFPAIDGDKAVLLSTGNEDSYNNVLSWTGISGNAIPTASAAEPAKSKSGSFNSRSASRSVGKIVDPSLDPPPDFPELAGEYSTFSFNNLAIPSGTNYLLIDYYFISDEFLEFIGSEFDDVATFIVSDRGGHAVNGVIESVNKYENSSLRSQLVAAEDFPDSTLYVPPISKESAGDEGESDIYQTYRTPLRTLAVDLKNMVDIIDLVLSISDVGDNAYNSYIIFDNIRFVDKLT